LTSFPWPDPQPILDRLLGLHPKLIDLKLDRVYRLLAALGDPHLSLPPVVHVAGTNGKGSVIAMMRAVLEAAGYGVHVHISPHLVRFNERIRLAGDLIDDENLSKLLEECETANGGAPITFFEITTVAALLAFSRVTADIVLLETGLGGRLDATNVVPRPVLTIITPVSMDHQQFLGETLADMAQEKAGILKAGVACVLAPQEKEVADVILASAAKVGATVIQELPQDLPPSNLAGPHQAVNASMAVAALRSLDGFTISDAHIAEGLARVDWPARLQRLSQGVLPKLLRPDLELWLDGGHNEGAARVIAVWLEEEQKPLHLIMGMLNSKDPAAFLAPLKPHITSLRTVAIPGEDASLGAEDLARIAEKTGVAASASASVSQALAEIARDQPGPGRVLIAGSLYLAGRVLAENAVSG